MGTVNKWNATRAKLKIEFDRMGITRCEKCKSGMYLSFAHRLKRRFIHTDEELRQVALLCTTCHNVIERKSHAEMFRLVTEIIENRTAVYEAA